MRVALVNGIVSKAKGSKSTVWSYFGFEADNESKANQEDIAICQCCKNVSQLKVVTHRFY